MSAARDNALEAQLEAVTRARAELRTRNLDEVIRRTGAAPQQEGGCLQMPFLDRLIDISQCGFEINARGAAPFSALPQSLNATEELLVLRYLAAPCEVRAIGEHISFRDLPGGQFYLQPILNRTTAMLVRRIGANVEALRSAAAHIPHHLLDAGDFSAQFQVIGRVEMTLIYRAADEEFPASADLAFDRIAARIFHTDEVAALAHLLCRKLI